MYEVRIILINRFGEFVGKKVKVDDIGLKKIKSISVTFYQQGGFELDCEDGNFLVVPPNIIMESLVKLEINKI
jgi:hypothetical protein